MSQKEQGSIVPPEVIINKIYLIRDKKVMLDRDLAELYAVETKQLKRGVRRNIRRFPEDFMFELTKGEFDHLRSQIGTSSWGGTRYFPMAFTEQGVAMLSSVLNSDRAVDVNIGIMRIFTKMREMLATHKDLLIKMSEQFLTMIRTSSKSLNTSNSLSKNKLSLGNQSDSKLIRNNSQLFL